MSVPWRAPTRWAIWQRPWEAAVFLVVVDLVAVTLVVGAARRDPTGHVLDLVVLAALAVAYDEFTRRIENQRRGVGSGTHVSMRSVWAVVGIITLPLDLFAVLAAAMYLHVWLVSGRDGAPMAPYRAVFNAATMVVSAAAAAGVVTALAPLPLPHFPMLAGVLLVLLAALAYFVVNTLLVAGVFATVRGRVQVADLGSRSENLLELGTLGLGATAALAGSSWVVLLVMPVMYLVQRSALVGELEAAATQDPKTGLLNSAAWHALAERECARSAAAQRRVALLVVDVDHFKVVNDRHGHLVGDRVLQGVAACLTGTLRDRDIVGRFGGEEFVALLPDLHLDAGTAVAERVRETIAAVVHATDTDGGPGGAISVTASIGLAGLPEHGTDLISLIAAADAAMYVAKQAGRDRVAVAPGVAGGG